jgi:dihydroneopterin aldolase
MVRLGCTPDEQLNPQEVRISFELRFQEPPGACLSDQLEDTLCYASLSKAIQSYCTSTHFKTIEKIAMNCHELLQERCPKICAIQVRVHKVRPPVESLLGGAHFVIESER